MAAFPPAGPISHVRHRTWSLTNCPPLSQLSQLAWSLTGEPQLIHPKGQRPPILPVGRTNSRNWAYLCMTCYGGPSRPLGAFWYDTRDPSVQSQRIPPILWKILQRFYFMATVRLWWAPCSLKNTVLILLMTERKTYGNNSEKKHFACEQKWTLKWK